MSSLSESASGNSTKRMEGEMDRESFLNAFSECVANHDYNTALSICTKRLKAKPNDSYVLELKQTVLHFLEKAEDTSPEQKGTFDNDWEAPQLSQQEERAATACDRAYEAMFTYLKDEDNLWSLGEQAVGIFWDPGQLLPEGPRRSRVLEMAKVLLEVLLRKLGAADRGKGAPLPAMSVAADLEVSSGGEWLFEALGQLWFRREMELPCEPWLVDGCREEWDKTEGSMEALVGFSAESLHKATCGDLTDILCQVWTLERSCIGDLFEGSTPPSAELEYGIGTVLAEIQRRPLVEPPMPGFYECFYLMTHVVYVLNCFNGCLPNHREDCPWLYAYLERCLGFWIREVRQAAGRNEIEAAYSWSSEAVDAISEAVDCLRGLDNEAETQAVREGVDFLLSAQGADGFFQSPGAKPASTTYNHIHPSWTAVAALQLDRQAERGSSRSAKWSQHARNAAQEIGFFKSPPPPSLIQHTGDTC